ncbi:MAG: hypothetical protein ACRDJB_01545 [Actinomycetota bacterium]
MPEIILAHGVGRVYQSPIPLWLYLSGAAATVAASFLLRALVRDTGSARPVKRIADDTFALVASRLLTLIGVFFLLLTVVSGVFGGDEGFGLASLLFWVGLVVGTVAAGTIVAGTWRRADPWATLERIYRVDDQVTRGSSTTPREASAARRAEKLWWLAPLSIYLLFWFELVSGVGFDSFFIVVALLLYTLFVLSFRASLGPTFDLVDPLAILFGFAERLAPLELRADGLYYRGWIRSPDEDRPMPRGLYAAVFVLLASTTLDNVRETVGWTDFRDAVGLGGANDMLVDSVALAAFSLLFLLPFMLTVWASQRFIEERMSFDGVARRFGWSLIPIGIAYVLAHNTPLVMTGVPLLLRGLSDPFGRGWNLLGTGTLLQGYFPSPALVWFLEIALIVGGHILGVLAAHRTAVRLGRSHRAAVRSQYALTVLMSIFTITTLWLLSQPLVR